MSQLPRFRRLPRRIEAAPIRSYDGSWTLSELPAAPIAAQPIYLDGRVWTPDAWCDPEATTREIDYEKEL